MTKQEFIKYLAAVIKNAGHYINNDLKEVIEFELEDGFMVDIYIHKGD